jgi:serine/threonine protein kinase
MPDGLQDSSSICKATRHAAFAVGMETGPDPLAHPGLLLGRYRIVRKIGSGAMGVVFEAIQDECGLHVAVKVLNPTLVDREVARTRPLREGCAACQIQHRNVVKVFDVCVSEPPTS